jgi:hypothetical protein
MVTTLAPNDDDRDSRHVASRNPWDFIYWLYTTKVTAINDMMNEKFASAIRKMKY